MCATLGTYRLPGSPLPLSMGRLVQPTLYGSSRSIRIRRLGPWVQIPGKQLDSFQVRGSGGGAYAYAGLEQLRAACDFINLLFSITNEISDAQSGQGTKATGAILLNTLKNNNIDDGSKLCKMTKEHDFSHALLLQPRGASYNIRVLCQQVRKGGRTAREKEIVLNSVFYEKLRPQNRTVRYCYGLFGYILNIDLHDEIFEHPIFMRLHLAAVDMVTWSNDAYSYNMEQVMGHTVLQKQHN